MTDGNDFHPSLERLAAFDRGQLAPAERAEIESHVSSCSVCCRQLETLPEDSLIQAIKAASSSSILDGPPVPAELIDHPRYRILEVLGGGGMGTVFKAKHLLMDRMVALKVIRKDLLSRPDLVERFRQEVKAAARLTHPNIVAAYDAEQVGELNFLVMEYVEGANLDRLVTLRGPLSVPHACYLVQQAALGLQHAFERGITHRDVKPSNLFLTKDGHVKVMDFGLAYLSGSANPQTPADMLVGTPDYVAPDQVQHPQAGIRADIYSLGCVFYFLLAGRPPFPGDALLEKLLAHQNQPPAPLREQRADVPAEVAALVERMLAKSPEERPQTPVEVAHALDGFAPSDPNSLASFADPSPSLAELPTYHLAPVPRRRRRWPVALGLMGLILLGGVVTLAFWHRADGDEHSDLRTESRGEPTTAASEHERPVPPPLSHQELHDKALAWFKENNRVKEGQGFLERLTEQLDERLERRGGFYYEVGSGLVVSNRTTLVMACSGRLQIFELTNAQARNWPHQKGSIITINFSEPEVLDQVPDIELSEPQFDNALQIDADQPLTGTVKVRCRTAVEGPLMLRFASPANGSLISGHFRLPRGLPAGPSTCTFSFGRLNYRDDPPRIGPYVVSLKVCRMEKVGDKDIEHVLSNAVADVVNVRPR